MSLTTLLLLDTSLLFLTFSVKMSFCLFLWSTATGSIHPSGNSIYYKVCVSRNCGCLSVQLDFEIGIIHLQTSTVGVGGITEIVINHIVESQSLDTFLMLHGINI